MIVAIGEKDVTIQWVSVILRFRLCEELALMQSRKNMTIGAKKDWIASLRLAMTGGAEQLRLALIQQFFDL